MLHLGKQSPIGSVIALLSQADDDRRPQPHEQKGFKAPLYKDQKMIKENELKVVELSKVTVVEKNKGEEFRVSLRQYGSYKLLSCRVWYKDDAGQMRPSKKGIDIRVERARSLLDAMSRALAEAGSDR